MIDAPINEYYDDEAVKFIFSLTDEEIASRNDIPSPLGQLRRKPNKEGKPVDPKKPLWIIRNDFNLPVEVYNFDPNAGTWVAYHLDKSEVRTFATEIEALRYAVDNRMSVKFAKYGNPI